MFGGVDRVTTMKKHRKTAQNLVKYKKHIYIRENRGIFSYLLKNQKLLFEVFWLFLRSLSCIGSTGRLVGKKSSKIRPNPRQPLPILSKVNTR